MGVRASKSYYDAHAQTVDLDDITSSDRNAEILRRLRDNDPKLARLSITQDDFFGNRLVYDFVVQEGDDLEWLGYFIGRNTKLRSLRINDLPEYREQITALVRGIEQNRSIRNLYIYGDHLSGGESVLSSLSTMLQSESCSLTSLSLGNIRLVSDDAAVALADALKGNKSLKSLYFNPEALTLDGWSAFSKLLCDTSSVSNTYASNHSLREIGNDITRRNYPQDVKQLLALNELTGKHAAIQKILKYHPDFDVGPFLGKKLKLLPLVMSWFESVSRQQAEMFESARMDIVMNPDGVLRILEIQSVSVGEIQKRQLSTSTTLSVVCLSRQLMATVVTRVARRRSLTCYVVTSCALLCCIASCICVCLLGVILLRLCRHFAFVYYK